MEDSLFIVAIQARNGAKPTWFKLYTVHYHRQVLRKVPPPPKCPS